MREATGYDRNHDTPTKRERTMSKSETYKKGEMLGRAVGQLAVFTVNVIIWLGILLSRTPTYIVVASDMIAASYLRNRNADHSTAKGVAHDFKSWSEFALVTVGKAVEMQVGQFKENYMQSGSEQQGQQTSMNEY